MARRRRFSSPPQIGEPRAWTCGEPLAPVSTDVFYIPQNPRHLSRTPGICRRAKVRRKGGAIDVIVWQTGTARLLPRLLKGRTAGPVFVTARKARVQLAAGDLDPSGRARLSYQQAAALFSATSGGATLHQLRHSALTHDAEDGTGTPMLMARSGHTSVRSLAKYARVSAEALARHQAERDLAPRRPVMTIRYGRTI